MEFLTVGIARGCFVPPSPLINKSINFSVFLEKRSYYKKYRRINEQLTEILHEELSYNNPSSSGSDTVRHLADDNPIVQPQQQRRPWWIFTPWWYYWKRLTWIRNWRRGKLWFNTEIGKMSCRKQLYSINNKSTSPDF